MSWRKDGYVSCWDTTKVRYVLVDERDGDIILVSTKKEANEIIKEFGCPGDKPNRFRLVSLEPPREDES